jgi:hypothetical protein
MQEINTGMTTAMEELKFSKASRVDFGQLGKPPQVNVHPQRRGLSESEESSLRDTDSATTWLENLRGGAGSQEAVGGAHGGAAGAADGGAD